MPLVVVLALAVICPVRAAGQEISAMPLAEPIVSADALLRANRVVAWTQDGTSQLLLEGQMTFKMGTYGFRARKAVVRIEREQQPGRLIHHLALFMEAARPLHRQPGRVKVTSRQLLVTASTTGAVDLHTNLLERRETEPADPIVRQAQDRMKQHRAAITRSVDAIPGGLELPQLRNRLRNQEEKSPDQVPSPLRSDVPARTPTSESAREGPRRFVPVKGIVMVQYEKLNSRLSPEGRLVMLYGGVSVVFEKHGSDQRRAINLTCQNAVIFLGEEADPLPRATLPTQFNASGVRGIYLEDNVVVTDGSYTIRAPRVYYDPSTERAAVLDAVFYTWDIEHEVPIYVRARDLRQHSLRSWSAKQATLTTSAFAEPHFSIGVNQIKFELADQEDGTSVPRVSAKHVVPHVGKVPIGWLPGFEGDMQRFPIERVAARYDSNMGPQVTTRWDVFSLLKRSAPDGVDLKGQVDYRGDHGPAVGLNLDYDQADLYGRVDSYLLPRDHQEDDISDRQVDHDGDVRGYFRGQHRQALTDDWELSVELAYVSDPTFLEEFFRQEADAAKAYETSLYLKHQKQSTQFSFLAQYDLLNFTPQTTDLQAPGYGVEKLPELGYYHVGTSFLDDRLTYYTENRLSHVRTRAGRDLPTDRGFSTLQSLVAFGFPPTVAFDTAATTSGVPSGYVGRLDTRHEIQAPIKLGMISFVPYIAGRATLYDDDFKAFNGKGDNARLWAMGGSRIHTRFMKMYDLENATLDVHRLRHVVEPSVDVFVADATIGDRDLPVYDSEVEAISEGSGTRIGVRNTLQTERGGPGRWRSVDWVVVNTDLVLRSDDSDLAAEPARFFSYRPEYSTGRDHIYADLAWMLSDTLAVSADLTHSLEIDQLAQWHAGAILRHTPHLTTYIEYETIDVLPSRLLSAGLTYQLTRKYRLGLDQRWDLDRRSSRRTQLILERKLPRWTLLVVASVDDIDDGQSIGVVLIPDGVRSSRRLGPLGAN